MDDRRCGRRHRLPDGSPGQCNPDRENPCCNSIIGLCGNTSEYCSCEYCINYNVMYQEWRESGGEQRWRYDGKCDVGNPLLDGAPAECDPAGEKPLCCMGTGHCVRDDDVVHCPTSRTEYCKATYQQYYVDYRLVTELRKSGKNCTIAKEGGFLKNVCFNETSRQYYFKCTYSEVNYQEECLSSLWISSGHGSVSAVCDNDTFAYQACGLEKSITNTDVLCGGYFCKNKYNEAHKYIECSGEDCKAGNRNCITPPDKTAITICDDKCDSWNCFDESKCNGYHYGIACYAYNSDSKGLELKFFTVSSLCDDQVDCTDLSDELNCSASANTVHKCARRQRYGYPVKTVPLLNYTRCPVFDINKHVRPYCLDFLDQTNCSDIKRVGGYCEVKGFMSSVSKYMVCEDNFAGYESIKLCDDDLQKKCIKPSDYSDCKVHKHRMCDEIEDCSDGIDENHDMCEIMTRKLNFTCQRRFNTIFNYHWIPLPVSWILDNVTDCMDGEDEDKTRWKFCEGNRNQIYGPNVRCRNVFKCPSSNDRDNASSVPFEQLCDGVETCDKGAENVVCKIARDSPDINKTAGTLLNGKIKDVCKVGNTNTTCEEKDFIQPLGEVFGVPNLVLSVPKSKVNCSNLFGEYYLYLSCMGLCEESDIICPLENRTLYHDSCPQQFSDRAYTIANNSFVTFAVKSDNGKYEQNFYRCNKSKCVNYDQVCDLVDDCGDMSDEMNCANHMICKNTLDEEKYQFIALSQKCDGIYDCFDLSDECNESCNREILGGWVLKSIIWFMGILAVVFNGVTMAHGLSSIRESQTEKMMISKVLMSLIGSGDFLIGVYLMLLSIYDSLIFRSRNSYCQHQPEWLTGTPCIVLGVISTIGSQISLFSMTALSCIRAYGLVRKKMSIPGPVTRKSCIKVTSLAGTIIAVSLLIALTPLSPSLEDYFVQGMYYDPDYKLMIGFPNKERHIDILKAYYDHDSKDNTSTIADDLSWSEIREKVDGMFSQDHGIFRKSPVHFYGNDGVCLFKYFVRSDDARRSRNTTVSEADITDKKGDIAVWSMLLVNLICFLVITGCYLAIVRKTRKSTAESGQWDNPDRLKENQAMQKRVTLIIVTDFLCWVPFILISGLHNLEKIDASTWYVTFAMIVLPINSVINPLLYDKRLLEFLRGKLGLVREFLRKGELVAFEAVVGLWQRDNENAVPEEVIPLEFMNRDQV